MEIPEEILKKLESLKAKRILVQFPEGLKLKIQDLVEKLEEKGFQVVLCLEKCFGACDVREEEAEKLKCDAILHIGHEKFLAKTKIPVVYWEYFFEINPVKILEKELSKLKEFKKIGLVTSIQFVKTLPLVKEFLEKNGKEVFIHKSLQHPGQVLGCDLKAAKAIEEKVDCFLAISAGEFYAAGLTIKTEKPVLNLDLEKGEIKSLDGFKKKMEKVLAWNKEQFKGAKRIGFLISWKKGQMLGDPLSLKEKMEKKGKKVFLLAMDEISPEKLEGLKLDFLVNFGCPRIAIDDQAKFSIPILNHDELDQEI